MARFFRRKKFCRFTADDVKQIDYKDLTTLKSYITETGKIVASPAMVEHSDDLFYDASRGRVYVLGEGFIDVWQQKDPDHYERIQRVATPADARTGLFVPDLGELFETIRHHGRQPEQIDVYATK